MATEPENTQAAGDPPAAITPATNPPTPAAPPSQAAKPNGQGAKRGPEVRIPQAAFKARIEREAAAIVRKRLGISLEDAEKVVKAGGQAPAANGANAAQATADQAVAKLQGENEKLRRDAETSKRRAEEWERKHRKDTQRLKDRQIESELRFLAAQTGIVDTEYAVHLFSRASASDKAQEPQPFFASLKTTHAYLFTTPTAPPPKAVTPVVMATTAPPESGQPGESTPRPAAAGAPKAPTDVTDLPNSQFAERTRAVYGYTAGQ